MIKTITVQTDEVDDADSAVSDIVSQLENREFKRNTIGIISCFAGFVSSGVVAALAARLPFPIAGCTTLAASTNGVQGHFILILTALTSDDVEFETGITGPISAEDAGPLKAAWDEALAKRNGKPSLMISFGPLLNNVSADFFAESWSAITGNVPNFGTLAVDHNHDYHESQTILGAEAFRDRYVFVLCYGNVEPRFFVGGVSEEKAFREKGVVTASRGNQLKEVNGISVADYLVSLGLKKDENGVIQGINSFPFILDYNDGTQPVVRVMFAITPDGAAVCGGKIPVGATLTVGSISAEKVLSNTENVLRQALEEIGDRSLLIFPCVGRYFAQGFDTSAEMDRVEKLLGNTPFHLSYSGTELCPVYGKDGTITNRSHNDTIVICML
jgi:hypothetical protein